MLGRQREVLSRVEDLPLIALAASQNRTRARFSAPRLFGLSARAFALLRERARS